jgi:hypothetical protein
MMQQVLLESTTNRQGILLIADEMMQQVLIESTTNRQCILLIACPHTHHTHTPTPYAYTPYSYTHTLLMPYTHHLTHPFTHFQQVKVDEKNISTDRKTIIKQMVRSRSFKRKAKRAKDWVTNSICE